MPHLQDELRKDLLEGRSSAPRDAAELNYAITFKIVQYLDFQPDLRYWMINDVLGALEGAKSEFIRNIVDPYEEQKASQNGNAYPEHLRVRTWWPRSGAGKDTAAASTAVSADKRSSSLVRVRRAAFSAVATASGAIVAAYGSLRRTASRPKSTTRS